MSLANVSQQIAAGAAGTQMTGQAGNGGEVRTVDSLDAHVPAEMKACPQWLVWRSETRPSSSAAKNGETPKPTKVPYVAVADARKMRRADVTDRSCFATYERAKAAYLAVSGGVSGEGGEGGYAGIAFVFTPEDPFCGVDLDDCIDPASGELKAWGREIVDLLDSYTEVSPSGTGVKIFLQGKKPGTRARRRIGGGGDGEVEVYDAGRYFTVTGRRLQSGRKGAAGAELRQEQLQVLYDRVMEPKTPGKTKEASAPWAMEAPAKKELIDLVRPEAERSDPDQPDGVRYELRDEEIILRASRSKSGGGKFSALFAGNWEAYFGSQSEADSSVVFTLAYYTKDPVQIDRVFRQSRLFRPKWDERHGTRTYGQMTIDNALALVTRQYRPHRPSQKSAVVVNQSDGVEREENGLISLGQRCPETGRIVLSPTRTLPTAEAFVREKYTVAAGGAVTVSGGDGLQLPTLWCYAGMFFAWQRNRYVPIEDRQLRHELQPWLHDAMKYKHNERTGVWKLVDFDGNAASIASALEAVRDRYFLDHDLTPTCWLPDRYLPAGLKGETLPGSLTRPDPRSLLAFPSGTLNLKTREVLPPTPTLFNTNAIEFDYDPSPEPCERWIKFMEQLFGDDLESMYLLQEWMGYCLVSDTSQQKIMLMVGPKRSGKGTIGRVLQALVGASNVVGPTTTSLAGAFGLQQLIGKSVAVVSDARFSGEGVSVVIERLLCISGEDALSIDRKYLGNVTMKLPTRFMLLTNEFPRLTDASGALAGRFVILRLTRSFYGQEDVSLTEKLTEELPGILLWAIEGLMRLRRQGRFTRPKSTEDAQIELQDLSSPVSAFVREYCQLGLGFRVTIDDIYAAWKSWSEAEGRSKVTSRQVFGRDLMAAFPSVTRHKNSGTGRFYLGIKLKDEVAAAACPF